MAKCKEEKWLYNRAMNTRMRVVLGLLSVGTMFGLFWSLQSMRRVPQTTEVKQQVINLPVNAFDGDPRLQKAVQDLQNAQNTQSAQQPVGPAPTSSLNTLQPGGSVN